MGHPDESLIKDVDLREALERQRARTRGVGMFDFEVRELVVEQQTRDKARDLKAIELAALPREKRRRAVIREVFENSAPTAADLRHIHSVLAVCGLPHDRLPVEEREYKRVQGNMGILVQAGSSLNPHTGEWVQQPLPFGPKARLILMHLCSEAIRQKSPKIEIADTFTAFVRDMGFPDSGGKKGPLTAFREQLNALASCSIKMSSWTDNKLKSKQFFPIEEMDVWLSKDHDQPSLWASTVTFSQTMFESLQKHALPVNSRAVRAIQGSSRKLDLYFWLGWRMNNIQDPLHISWKAIGEQFGAGFTRERDFRAKFREEVAHLKELFPKLPLKLSDEGLTLSPAESSVFALPTPKSARKK